MIHRRRFRAGGITSVLKRIVSGQRKSQADIQFFEARQDAIQEGGSERSPRLEHAGLWNQDPERIEVIYLKRGDISHHFRDIGEPAERYQQASYTGLSLANIRLHTRRSAIAAMLQSVSQSFSRIRMTDSSHRQCEPHEDRKRSA